MDFNFTTQICTTKEQTERLLTLGLKKETSDMCLDNMGNVYIYPSTIIEVIKNNAGEYLQSVKLFDVYEGSQVEEGKKSMAFNLVYSSLEKTLTVEEIDDSVKKVLKALRDSLGAELR